MNDFETVVPIEILPVPSSLKRYTVSLPLSALQLPAMETFFALPHDASISTATSANIVNEIFFIQISPF